MTTIERIPSGVAEPTTNVADVISLAREAGTLIVDLRFVDLPGQAQHFSIPIKELSENLFIDGFYQRHFWILLACAFGLPVFRSARRRATAVWRGEVAYGLS